MALYNDRRPSTRRRAHLGYGTPQKARRTVKALRKAPRGYARRAAQTMYFRAKHHAQQTTDMRSAMKVYKQFLNSFPKKQVGGGRRSLLPFDGTPKPGDRIEFPTQEAKIREDMKENWEFILIQGHGASIPLEYKVVPDDTYIVFNAPSGCSVTTPVVPFEETTVAPSADLFIAQLLRDHKRSIARMHALANKVPVLGGDSDFLLRTLAPSEREELRRCPFPEPSFKNASTRAATGLCAQGSAYSMRTIYGPGELYPNLLVSFSNTYPSTLFLLGMYVLPIHPTMADKIFDTSSAIAMELNRLETYKKALTEDDKKSIKGLINRFDSALFGTKGDYGKLNLASNLIGRKGSLDEVLRLCLPKVKPTKSRVIFVNACRGVAPAESKPDADEATARLASLMRQASLEVDTKAAEALREEVKKAAGAYYDLLTDSSGAAAPAAPAAGAATGGAGTSGSV